MSHEIPPVECAFPGCEATFVPHKWGSIKAHEQGWFTEQSGKVWCPDHNPSWVSEWRAKQREKTE